MLLCEDLGEQCKQTVAENFQPGLEDLLSLLPQTRTISICQKITLSKPYEASNLLKLF